MKNCPNCGHQNPETTRYCLNCGEELYQIPEANPEQQADEPSAPETSSAQPVDNPPALTEINKSKVLAVLGIIGGVLSAIFGIVMFSMQSDVAMQSHRYGGDFYTGTSEQLEGLGEYLESISKILSVGFGFLLIIFGLFMIWYFAGKLTDK